MAPNIIVLWVYIVLLELGGIMGFIKAKSVVSILMASVFAGLLILCALGIFRPFYIADILIGILAVMFVMRFAKGKKFMPSGFMAILSIIVLVALLVLH